MPPVEGCTKQDYAVLIVIGVAWKTEHQWCTDSLRIDLNKRLPVPFIRPKLHVASSGTV